jgi:uncharacterized circularly permuted ATP-grasp superfamily protein
MKSTQVAREILPPGSLLSGYEPPRGVYDELVGPDGALRPHWKSFVELLEALGADELDRRWQQARRLIHEHGVTYNVHGDPEGRDRRWELDALPLVVPHAEWAVLSGGLEQRARLLNAVLSDLYGPRRLLGEGLLPAELVFAHPGFLRPAHGVAVRENRYLHLYTASSSRGCCRICSIICRSSGWRAFSSPCATRWAAWPIGAATIRTSRC